MVGYLFINGAPGWVPRIAGFLEFLGLAFGVFWAHSIGFFNF